MNEKKSRTLYGELIAPLEVGCCALIRNEGMVLRTSTVAAILSVNGREIRFETQNTVYRLLPDAFPQRAKGCFGRLAA